MFPKTIRKPRSDQFFSCVVCGSRKSLPAFLKRRRPVDGYCDTCLECRMCPCNCGCGQLTNGFVATRTRKVVSFISGHHNRMDSQKQSVRTGQLRGKEAGNYKKSAEWRKQASELKLGERNHNFGRSDFMRSIFPDRAGKKNPHYGKPAAHGKGDWFVDRKGRKFWLRSTWEIRVAEWLDSRWLTWDYERDRYELNGATYLPDFWIEEFGCYWEVKGWFHERHQNTLKAFRGLYPQYPVVVLMKAVMRHLFGKRFK